MSLDSLNNIKRRNLITLAITKLLHGFGTGMFGIIYQPFLLDLTNSIVLTGLFVSIGLMMQFTPMPWIGKLSDKYNRKYILITSVPIYIMGLLFLILASSTTIYFIVFGILFYFLGFIINNLNTQFIVADNTSKSKGLMFGFMYFSYFGGSIAGTIFIILGAGLENRFIMMIFIFLLLIEELFFIFSLSARNTHIRNPESKPINTFNKKENMWKKILKTKSLRSILIFFCLDIFVYSISLSIYTGGLYDFYHLSEQDIAMIALWFNIGNAVFQIPAGRITDKIGNKKTLILSQIFGFGFFFTNILAVIFWMNFFKQILIMTLSIGYLSLALSVCTFIPAEQVILTNLGEDQKAESYGIVSFFRGIALIPTGFLGGLLVENVHYIAPFIFSVIGLGFELLFLIKFFHE
jgi:MFS family permease